VDFFHWGVPIFNAKKSTIILLFLETTNINNIF